MALRTPTLAPGEHYHIYTRGTLKQQIFFDDHDYGRFLFLLFASLSPVPVANAGYAVTRYLRQGDTLLTKKQFEKIPASPPIHIVAFTLMPNHIHLLLEEVTDNGISSVLHRTLTGYARYLNTKYERSGHVFQGPFQAVHVESNEQLLYLSAYIHRNQRDLKKWKDREERYPWSSLADYIGENRWDKLLHPEIILEQFPNQSEYLSFIKTHTAKED